MLAIFEHSPNGAAALGQAAELTTGSRSELTVVTLAPQQDCQRCCGPSAEPFNAAVREDAERDLRVERELVGPAAGRIQGSARRVRSAGRGMDRRAEV